MNNGFNNNINNNNINRNNYGNQNPIYYGQNNFQGYQAYNPQNNIPNNYNQYVNKSNITSSPSKEKLRYGKIIVMPLFILAIVVWALIFTKNFTSQSDKKSRTFMIYMAGSDLESKSKQGTFSLDEINPNNIDLNSNNIVLMVGGSKKWHNFVNPDEVAIYELTNEGFIKKQTESSVNMGSSNTLKDFLNYSYNNYPAENFDLIFWNHGLGSIGLEHDEISDDYINIAELDTALRNSTFGNTNKLELTIFYNCLAENLQMASIMKKYSNYMLGSEEIIYMSKSFNRLTFFEDIKENDTVIDVAKHFIDKSEKLLEDYNKRHSKKINYTLSLINLKKLENIEEALNSFIDSIDLGSNYSNIAKERRLLYTYGSGQGYDTVDLYSLVEAMSSYSNNKKSADKVEALIKDAVEYNSTSNDYSYGLSIYFPYFSSNNIIESHLNLFETIWSSSYYKFIRNFQDIRVNYFRSNRALTGKNVNYLTKNVNVNNNVIELELNDRENSLYQNANIYIFSKGEDDKYELLLKSNNIEKDSNKLLYKYNGLLKANGELITYSENDNTIYGYVYDDSDKMDAIFNLNMGDNITIDEVFLDSGSNPTSGIIDKSLYENIAISKNEYTIFENGDIVEEWIKDYTKDNIETNFDTINITKDNYPLSGLYVMYEMYDESNDVYYTNLYRIN